MLPTKLAAVMFPGVSGDLAACCLSDCAQRGDRVVVRLCCLASLINEITGQLSTRTVTLSSPLSKPFRTQKKAYRSNRSAQAKNRNNRCAGGQCCALPACERPLNLPLVNSARGHRQHFGQHNTVTAIRAYTIASQCQVHMTTGSGSA